MFDRKFNQNKRIKIGRSLIGDDCPTYIIAEIGINHNGSTETARKLIDEAAIAGVDAVKFQKRNLESLYTQDVLSDTNKYEQNFQYMIPILKQVELSDKDFIELKAYSEEKGLEFLCTPFDIPSADFLADIGVNAFKIASADLNNLFLLGHIADNKKPMIVSTGMSYWNEIEKTVHLLELKQIPFVLLHCRSSYPVWPREVNLKMIRKLSEFGCLVGYSGHDVGITIPLIAASMGACVIEKHITLDKKMDGPDHKISLEPFELRRLVRDIKIADQAMGKDSRFLLRGEILNRELFGKSLAASEPIEKGVLITKDRIKVIGPGKGIPPSKIDIIEGKPSPKNYHTDDLFSEDDFKGSKADLAFNQFRSDWGLIVRYDDLQQFIPYSPKVFEFHFTYNDLNRPFAPATSYKQALIVHAPEYFGENLLDLCSTDNDIRRASVDIINKSIERTKSLSAFFNGGIPKVIAHPGAMSLNTKLKKPVLKEKLLQSLTEIDASGVELLLENLPPYPWYFGGQWKGNYFMNPDEIDRICIEAELGLCFDLSHAFLYCNSKHINILNYIEKVSSHIRHIHFADGYGLDGEGVQIGEGDIDFETVMPLFKKYTGTWVPEIWRGHLENGQGFIKALSRLSEYNL